MKRVAIIGTRGYPSYYGGFETAVRKLAPYLADEGWDVTVYSRPGATKFGDSERDVRVKSVTTKGLESRSFSTLTYGFSSSIHALRTRPDVVLVMNVANGFWLPLLKLRGIPTLVNVDGMEWERAKWGRLASAVFKLGARMTTRWADELVVDAKAIGQRWQDLFARRGVFIPYGGETPGPLPVPLDLTHRGYILMVARLVPENSVGEFLEAASSLSETWDVVIVGSAGYGGEIESRTQKLTERNARIRWLGHVSDDSLLFSLWQHAGVYFHGHSVGGTNPALVQAMAAGAPVVARDTVFNREVVMDAGVFVEANPDSIVDAVSRLMNNSDEQEKFSARAISRAATDYSWLSVCAAYGEALRSLLRSKSSDKSTGS